ETVNRYALEYFGATLEDLRRSTSSDIIHPDDLPAVAAAWRRSVETGEPYNVEHRIRGANGRYRWFEVRGLPLRDSHGRITRWCNVQTDIDEHRRTQALLEGEKRFLELVAGDHAMPDVLDAVCQLIERIASGCY